MYAVHIYDSLNLHTLPRLIRAAEAQAPVVAPFRVLLSPKCAVTHTENDSTDYLQPLARRRPARVRSDR